MSLFRINNEGHSPGTTHKIISQTADCHGIYAHTLPMLPKLYMLCKFCQHLSAIMKGSTIGTRCGIKT